MKQITQTAFYENEGFATPFYICALLQESVTPLRQYALSIRTHSGTLLRYYHLVGAYLTNSSRIDAEFQVSSAVVLKNTPQL